MGVAPRERVVTTNVSMLRSKLDEVFDTSTHPVEVIRRVRRVLGRVYHDSNNPLAIVSGNAQFLLELGKSMDLGDDVVQPIRDIDEASERVASGLREIAILRDRIGDYLNRLEESGTT